MLTLLCLSIGPMRNIALKCRQNFLLPNIVTVQLEKLISSLEVTVLSFIVWRKNNSQKVRYFVPGEGVEPSRVVTQRFLRPSCLPFHHPGLSKFSAISLIISLPNPDLKYFSNLLASILSSHNST